jgi:peptidoglycan/xylan/chitin deacetylase (PgdA/CDA1 family)
MALALVVAVAAAGAAWVALATRSGNHPARSATSARPRPATSPQAHRRKRAHRATPADAAVARFTRIGAPIYCGGRRGRAVALTFDDGPGVYTRFALRLLRRYHAHATFFLVGRVIAGWPHIPARERTLGVLGDHTWSHAYLPALSPGAIAGQLTETRQAIATRAHVEVRLFRPPYGARNATVDRITRRLGMLEVLWNVDSLDWAGADPNGITRNVTSHLSPGAIVLMHENRGQTIKALKYLLLPALRRLHYRLVTVPELLATDPPSITQLHRGLKGCTRNTPSLHTKGG